MEQQEYPNQQENNISKCMVEKGIKHISGIYDYRTHTFYSFQELVNLYDLPINELFFYNHLKSCIPNNWKLSLKEETIKNTRLNQQNCELYNKLMKSKQANTFLYTYQLKHQHSNISKSEEKWSIELNKQNTKLRKVYKNIYSATIDNELVLVWRP